MKFGKKTAKRAARVTAAALASALLLTSCSLITINHEKFGGTDAAPTTDPVTDPVQSATDGGTEFTPPDEYEYVGKDKAEKLLSEIKFDFGGESLFICASDEDAVDRVLAISEDEGSEYTAAKYDRRRMVEQALNCNLRYMTATTEEMIEALKTSVETDSYYADLLALNGKELAMLAREGLLLNLRSLAFLDTNAEYFHPATSDISAGNSVYGIVSWATIDPDEISCIFYDTEKVEADIPSLVRRGEWTWDELLKLTSEGGVSAEAVPDDNGENIINRDRLLRLVSVSCGLDFISNEPGVTPETLLPAELPETAEICRALLGEGGALPGINRFVSGDCAFHIGTLADMAALSTVGIVWDIAPIPKLTASQESYSSLMPETSLILAAPVNMTNPDGASAILRALAASSYSYLRDAYIEYHMFNTVRLESSLEMLEYVYDSASYDLADILSRADESAADVFPGILSDAVSDADTDIEKLFERRSKKADELLEEMFGVDN